jgi:hypothetical protein
MSVLARAARRCKALIWPVCGGGRKCSSATPSGRTPNSRRMWARASGTRQSSGGRGRYTRSRAGSSVSFRQARSSSAMSVSGWAAVAGSARPRRGRSRNIYHLRGRYLDLRRREGKRVEIAYAKRNLTGGCTL